MIYKHKSFFNKRKAFTLVELLIVIAIIGILFIVLISKVDFATDKAKATGVQTDFRSFQVALETVARENAGFNTFGWDTGDVNANGKNDTYDEGDTNHNNIKDNDEIWIGHKVPGETFTQVFTLVKPGTEFDTVGYDADAIANLEAAINANLDPKLHITIGTDGKITMANGAQDPWKTEYHGYYITNALADGKDRGAIIIYSNGANQEFGSEHSIENGVVSISIPGNNVYGKDDYALASCYGFSDGYGKVNSTTSGFSNNQGGGQAGSEGAFVPGNGGSGETPDDDVTVSIPYETREPGLYETGTNNLLYSWQELIDLNIVTTDGRGSGSDTSYGNPKGPDKNVVDFLVGDLQYPDYISKVPRYAFSGCTKLTGVILTSGTTILDDYSFGSLQNIEMFRVYGVKQYNSALYRTSANGFYFDNANSLFELTCMSSPWLNDFFAYNGMGSNTKIYIDNVLTEHLVVPDGCETFASGLFYECGGVKTITLPESFKTIPTGAFYKCTSLESINLDNVEIIGRSAFIGAKSLSEINLDSIKTVSYRAFKDCSSLQKITIGNEITTLTLGAFQGCSDDLEIHFGSLDVWNNCIVKYGSADANGLTNAKAYRLFVNGVEITGDFVAPDSWTKIADGLFSGVSITSITLHDNIESIGEYAFYATAIDKVDVPDSVKSIGASAFSYCKNMEYVNINESSQLEFLGDHAFSYCEKIESLHIPPLVKNIDAHYLVLYCNKLKEFTFSPNSQLEYLNVSFGFVDYVTIYLPDSVKVIKDLDINVNWNSGLVIGENSQLERMEGKIFDRYSGNIFIPKNLSYISDSWAEYQFSPKITIHPGNTNFKIIDGCFVDISNKSIRASTYVNSQVATVPTDGSVTTLHKSSGGAIKYIPLTITSINNYTWQNATGYLHELTYEGTIEQWKTITAGKTLDGVKSIQCSDGKINASGNIIE